MLEVNITLIIVHNINPTNLIGLSIASLAKQSKEVPMEGASLIQFKSDAERLLVNRRGWLVPCPTISVLLSKSLSKLYQGSSPASLTPPIPKPCLWPNVEH